MSQDGYTSAQNISVGILLSASISQGEACSNDELCSFLVAQNVITNDMSLQGTFKPERYTISAPTHEISIGNVFTFRNSTVSLLIDPPEQLRYQGAFELAGGEDYPLPFVGNLTSLAGNAFLNAKLQ